MLGKKIVHYDILHAKFEDLFLGALSLRYKEANNFVLAASTMVAVDNVVWHIANCAEWGVGNGRVFFTAVSGDIPARCSSAVS